MWSDHVIADLGENTCLLQIDRLFLHEMSGSVALRQLWAPQNAAVSVSEVDPSRASHMRMRRVLPRVAGVLMGGERVV